jgi:hypothetical protein
MLDILLALKLSTKTRPLSPSSLLVGTDSHLLNQKPFVNSRYVYGSG